MISQSDIIQANQVALKPISFESLGRSSIRGYWLSKGASLQMNKRQQITLDSIFEKPTRADIRWAAIESLIKALGGEISERAGSRVAVRLNGVIAVFHRPHPSPETKKGAVDAMRQFLTNAGVKP